MSRLARGCNVLAMHASTLTLQKDPATPEEFWEYAQAEDELYTGAWIDTQHGTYEHMRAHERHYAAEEEEFEAYVAAGHRSVCPKCGQRKVTNRSVVTLGYRGHPGAEESTLYECENCDYKEL